MKKITKIIIVIIVGLVFTASCFGATKMKKKDMKAKWQKTSLEMKLSAAMGQFEAGQYEGLEAVAKECISSDSNLSDAHLLLGKVKLMQGDFSEAKNSFQRYVQLKADSSEGWFSLGLACEHLNDSDGALNCYQKAIELSPENTDYIITLGRRYVAVNKFSEAEKLYQEKISACPGDIDLKIAAGQMYLAAGQNEKAASIYEQAQLTEPDNTELLEALGSCYILTGNWYKAHDVHKQLYKRCSDDMKKNGYLRIMALCATNSGDYVTAMKYYSVLTAQNKTDTQLWFLMGQAAIGADLPNQALISSRKILAINPNASEAYLLSGSAKYRNGNYSQAIDDFHRAAGEGDCAHFAWLMAARCYEKMGYAAQAKAAYEKAAQYSNSSELQKVLVKSEVKS